MVLVKVVLQLLDLVVIPVVMVGLQILVTMVLVEEAVPVVLVVTFFHQQDPMVDLVV